MRYLLFCSFFIIGLSSAAELAKIFKDGMVLQATPTIAKIWGWQEGDPNDWPPIDITTNCELNGKKFQTKMKYVHNKDEDDDKWSFEVPNPENTVCNFKISQDGKDVTINNVIYGDVWICSGQSNMQWKFGDIFNATEEIEKMKEYPGIRMYQVKMMLSQEQQDDLMEEDWIIWANTSESVVVSQFSAVCLLTARYMADILGKDKVFGLIETNWYGTIIEAWMPKEPLDACNIEPYTNEDPNNPNSNSVLYNAMIHPLVRMSIKGALWYQGESNFGWNREEYLCTFPALISEWRKTWSKYTPTSDTFPFGFMQISTWDAGMKEPNCPVIRWHQTADHGYVPNNDLKNVFMGVAIDTYDKESGIHPRNKQLPSQRLAWAGLNIAYGMTRYPVYGPFPRVWNFIALQDGIQVDILYNKKFIWNVVESEGFYVCCMETADACNMVNGAWEKLPEGSVSNNDQTLSMMIPSCSIALAYLWETTPVLGTRALPMYADDIFGLPGAPWMKNIDLM